MGSSVPAALSTVAIDDGRLHVGWTSGDRGRFHLEWLRGHCSCARCRHPVTGEPTPDQLTASDATIVALSVTDGRGVQIVWADGGHTSTYDSRWLHRHSYDPVLRPPVEPDRILWDAATLGAVPTFHGKDVFADASTRLAMLRTLWRFGFVLLRGLPATSGTVMDVANTLAFALPTNFGTMFDVFDKAAPTSNAYTALELLPHTDLAHHTTAPGIQLLHCLVNTVTGGESIIVDAFRVATALRERSRDDFDLLATTAIRFRYHDTTSDHRWRGPLLTVDVEGNLAQVRFAPNVTAPFDVPADRYLPYRKAYRAFVDLVRDRRFQARFRFEAGDVVITDNVRALHGRTAYDAASGVRHLQGCYMESSEILSLICVLERPGDGTV